MYIPNIKSKEEFLLRFNKLFEYLEKKEEKTTAEKALFRRLISVRNNIIYHIPLEYDKDGYNYTIIYFELAGGWEMMQSIGDEATDFLYYFVQNY